jgi:hypothetical protein
MRRANHRSRVRDCDSAGGPERFDAPHARIADTVPSRHATNGSSGRLAYAESRSRRLSFDQSVLLDPGGNFLNISVTPLFRLAAFF